jgi:hypothetical protein
LTERATFSDDITDDDTVYSGDHLSVDSLFKCLEADPVIRKGRHQGSEN